MGTTKTNGLGAAPQQRRPPTLKDVAGALGMHKSTVSLALSGKGTIAPETRERVLATARELGYHPNPIAQRLAHGQESSTVCIFSGILDVGLATEKILLVQRALNAHALEVPIYTCQDTPDDGGEAQAAQVRQLCRQRPRAVVCATPRVRTAVFEELAAFQRAGGAVISYDTPVPLDCDQVIFDREDNAYRAASHLLDMGHRRIGMAMSQVSVTAMMEGSDSTGKVTDPNAYRIRGFRRALSERGIPFRPEWFFQIATYERGGAEMARQFLAMKDRPTAIAVVNDYVALAFMTELMRAGVRVPEELSIIGHDDQPIATYCPVPLTSMSQPVDRIARAVADLLLGRLSGDVSPDAPARTVMVTGELVQRGSVAPVGQAAG
jgi:LacI family transcriptional regulator